MRATKSILLYRIIKYNSFAVRMAKIAENTFPSFINLLVLMIFVISIFALIGLSLFLGYFTEETILS